MHECIHTYDDTADMFDSQSWFRETLPYMWHSVLPARMHATVSDSFLRSVRVAAASNAA